MRVKITYVDTHFDDGLTSDDIDADTVELAKRAWKAKHWDCWCHLVNAHRT